VQKQAKFGFSLLRAAVKSGLAEGSNTESLVENGYLVLHHVVPTYLLRLIDAACVHKLKDAQSVDRRLKQDFVARYAVAGEILGMTADVLRAIGAPADIIADIVERKEGGSLQVENLTCVRAWLGYKASYRQALHYDLFRERVARMTLTGGVVTGAALAYIIPTETASAASYSAGSHKYNATGAAAHFPAPRPVQVPAGSILINSPLLAHFGSEGEQLPAGVTHRSALFLCAHKALSPSIPVETKYAHVGGVLQKIEEFGKAVYNNTPAQMRSGGKR
jgi:hypothetical protein